MKNVQCRKLNIDRTKAPNKVGTLKDISLFGNFQFPKAGQYSGGLIARSLAGAGKELKKTKAQVQALASRSCPIAGATGATTTEELYMPSTDRGNYSGEPYSIHFIQHATEPVVPVNMVPVEGLATHIAKSGYALKTGGAKRVTFTLEQKELMIEFYNRQANEGIRADPADCIVAMRERGLAVLKENQIRSWWSSYHQKRRRESERLAADLRQLQGQLTSSTSPASSFSGNTMPSATSAVSQNLNTLPSVNSAATPNANSQPSATTAAAQNVNSHPSATSAATQNLNTRPSVTSAATPNANRQPSVTTAATQSENSQPSATSASTLNANSQSSYTSPLAATLTANILPPFSSASVVSVTSLPSASIVSPMQSVQPTSALQVDLLGANVGTGVTEWYFPFNMSQSTIGNRNGSNACVFIAFNFGLLYQQCNLDNTLVGQNLNIHWQTALEHAIIAGNSTHDQLFDKEGINVTVEEGIDLAGDQCQVEQVYCEYNVFGANPLDQLNTAVRTLSQQCPSFHVLVVHEMALLIIVDSSGVLFIIDSHVHGTKGAVIARFQPNSHYQAQNFSVWLNRMLTQTHGVSLSMCSISSILYS